MEGRGILDLTHRHLSLRSLRRFLTAAGYSIVRVRGVPAPFPLALGDNLCSRMLVGINRLLILLLPGVFSTRIYAVGGAPLDHRQLLRYASRSRPNAPVHGRLKGEQAFSVTPTTKKLVSLWH